MAPTKMIADSKTAQQIAAVQENIQVDSFTDIAFEGAWKGRARSFWATAAVGIAVGAAIGLVAPFFPVIVGAQTIAGAAALMAKSVAVYSALGMASGFTVGVLVGATSGASASVAKEQERREKGKEIEQALLQFPNASISQPSLKSANEKRGFLQRVMEDYINIPTIIAFATFGAIGGGVMLGAYSALGSSAGASFLPVAKPVMDVLLGSAASSASGVAAYTIGVMASFGAVFGINMPKIAGDTTRFFGDMLGGKAFNSQKGPTSEQVRKPVFSQAIAVPPAEEKESGCSDKKYARMPRVSIALRQHYNSYEELMGLQANASSETVIRR